MIDISFSSELIEQITIMSLLSFLVVIVFAIIWLKDLFAAVILLGVYSLAAAAIFVVMDAVDVAFTEAAVGAGISTILLLGALSLTEHEQKPQTNKNPIAILIVLFTGGLLLYGTMDLPFYGSAVSAVNTHPEIAGRFIFESKFETGVPNIVTSVLASYRGYDTLGETAVVFTAAVAVLALIGLRRIYREDSSQEFGENSSLNTDNSSNTGNKSENQDIAKQFDETDIQFKKDGSIQTKYHDAQINDSDPKGGNSA